MPEYRLYTYDLWGNEEDGYTINDYYRQPDKFNIDEDIGDDEIIALIDFANPEDIRIHDIDFGDNGLPEQFYFETKDGKPVCELRKIN